MTAIHEKPEATSAKTDRDRVVVVDALRGFALFAVFLSNFVWAGLWMAVPEVMRDRAAGASLNWWVSIPMEWFVVQKGLGLFSILFGVSFALMLQNLEERHGDVARLFLRRLTVLLLIGLLHLVFLWYGDILHMYALSGFLLFMIRKVSNKVLLTLAALLIVVIPSLADLGGAMAPTASAPTDYELRWALFTGGSIRSVVSANWRIFMGFFKPTWIITTWAGVLGRVLLGYWLGRSQMLQRAHEHQRFWKTMLYVALPAGVLMHVILTAVDLRTDVDIVSTGTLSGVAARAILVPAQVATSLGYMAVFVVLWNGGYQRLGNWLAPAGRMALTNYLAQSVMMILIMYNVGLGLGLLGRLSGPSIVAIVCVLYFLQIVISTWWLKRYRFGPVEWAWRCLTYGNLQPFRL